MTQAQVIDALTKTKGMVYLAADALGVSPQTMYNYIERYPAIAAAIKQERGKFVDTAELALNRAVLKGEGWAVAFALKTIGKDRGFVERQEIVGTSTTPLTVELKWSDEGSGSSDK